MSAAHAPRGRQAQMMWGSGGGGPHPRLALVMFFRAHHEAVIFYNRASSTSTTLHSVARVSIPNPSQIPLCCCAWIRPSQVRSLNLLGD